MLLKDVFDTLNGVNGKEKKSVQQIAKELPFGEKKAKQILNSLGFFYQNSGEKGWKFEGDNSIMEKSILDFVEVKASNNTLVVKSRRNNKDKYKNSSEKDDDNKSKSNSVNASIESSIKDNKGESNELSEIVALINNEKDSNNARKYRGIYFDKDIDDFLNNVKHGNKSELVNKIIRAYLVENNLL